MKEHPTTLIQRGREISARRAFFRRVFCGVSLCSVVGLTSGCVTERVWNWAGEGKYTFIPSPVTSLGLLREEGQPDRLFFRVDSTIPGEEDDPGEVYVLEVPPDWKERRLLLVPDDIQPGDHQLSELLEVKSIAPLPDGRVVLLSPIPLQTTGSLPALEAAPYAYIEGPPGVLFIYGADDQRNRWIRLASAITGRVVTTPAPKFNYALATLATPVTASVDLVGVVIYAVLWPLWTSMDIGYGDGDDGYRPDGRYQPGRPRRELEPPPPSEGTAPE